MKCSRCNGSGVEPDATKLGQEMRRLRKDAGLSLRAIATRMGYSAAYLSDMELGRRPFGATQLDKFKNALNYHGVDKR